MARKPANEGVVRKEIEAFVRQEDALTTRNDAEGRLARIDFPVYMVTDDAHGAVEAALTSREQYLSEMKPFWDSMPKDAKLTHKLAVVVLSDALGVVSDDYTMTMGGKRIAGRNSAIVVKRAGQWRWKTMMEAGWGGMGPAPEAAPGPAPAPPPAPAPAAAPAPAPAPHGAPPPKR